MHEYGHYLQSQDLFVTKDLGGGNTKEIVFVNDENDNKK